MAVFLLPDSCCCRPRGGRSDGVGCLVHLWRTGQGVRVHPEGLARHIGAHKGGSLVVERSRIGSTARRFWQAFRAAFSQGLAQVVWELVAALFFFALGPVVVLLSYRFLAGHDLFVTAAPFVTLAILSQALFKFWNTVWRAIGRVFGLAGRALMAFRDSWREKKPASRVGRVLAQTREPSSAGSSVWGARVLLTGTGIFLSLLLLLAVRNRAEASVETTSRPVDGLELGRAAPLDSTVFYPVEARFGTWKASCEIDGLGSELPRASRQAVVGFVKAYGRCGTAKKPVQFEVRGFASSSQGGGLEPDDFDLACDEKGVWKDCLERQRCSSPASRGRSTCVADAFNLCVAEGRARHVAGRLKGMEAPGVKVKVRSWNDYAEMAGLQPVVDRKDSGYDPGFGAVNRRVEVVVTDPGACRTMMTVEKPVPGEPWAAKFQDWLERYVGAEGVLWH